jgi:hypothetical protein
MAQPDRKAQTVVDAATKDDPFGLRDVWPTEVAGNYRPFTPDEMDVIKNFGKTRRAPPGGKFEA